MPASPWSSVIRGNVALAPGAQKDAFNRLRTSQPVELFSASCEFDDQPNFYENVLTGGGTATYNANTSGVDMAVTATPGDAVVRVSRQYVRYRPGKSQQIFVTANFNGIEADCTKRAGLFDDRDLGAARTGDGIFFEVDPTGLFAVLRSSTSGASVDTRFAQASWNVDPLDGSGPSGLVMDAASLLNQQVMVFDFGWLGSAGVRWGFVLDGRLIIVHEYFPSNVITTPFMSVASLPVRWEISTTGAAGSMTATCASVQSEGGFNTIGIRRSASTGITPLTLTSNALKPLLSIRLKGDYRRGQLQPVGYNVLADGADDYQTFLLINANLGGPAPTWTSNGDTIVEHSTNSTDTIVSFDSIISVGYGSAGGGPIKSLAETNPLESDVPLTSTYDGTIDTLTLAIRPIPASPNTDFYGSLIWREFY